MNEAAASPQANMASQQTMANIAPQIDPLAAAQIAKLNAETEATKDANARENQKQGLILQNLQQDIAEKDSRIRVNDQTISKLSSDECLNYATITHYATQDAISRDTANAQISLWNTEMANNNAELMMTIENYDQLVAFRTLREENLKASNAEIWSRIDVNKAEAKRLAKILDVMDAEEDNLRATTRETNARVSYEYENEEFVKFKRQFVKNQSALASQQAAYWKDYRENPAKYRPKVKSTSHTFGTQQAHGSSTEMESN